MESEDQKVKRHERIIDKLRKMVEHERKNLKTARVMYTKEMSNKTELEYLLKQCADQVKNE